MSEFEYSKELIKQRKFNDALKILNKIKITGSHEKIYLEFGKSYMGIKEYDKAQKVLKKILKDKNIVAMSISLLLKIYAKTKFHSKV
jgi:tetratricopeptide (TPR) repeat protein